MKAPNKSTIIPSSKAYLVRGYDSQFMQWTEIDDHQSKLIFNWEHFNINIYTRPKRSERIFIAPKHDFSIEPEHRENITQAIVASFQIKISDLIIGVSPQSRGRIGYVKDKTVENNYRKVELKIDWLTASSEHSIELPVINENFQLQALSTSEFKSIEHSIDDAFNGLYSKTLQTLHKDVPADKTKRLKKLPENASYMLKSFDVKAPSFPTETSRKTDQGGLVSLFYGTNRKQGRAKVDIQTYSDIEINALQCGVCEVQIPIGHEEGELERPGKFLGKWEFPTDERKHFIIKHVTEMQTQTMLDNLRIALKNIESNQALLFVHGYNTSFDEAAYRTAQLTWDLQFSGVTGFFSWPSAGKLVPYSADGAAARSSAPLLKDFISKLCNLKDIEHVHIIAHSMGGLVLTLALKDMKTELGFDPLLNKINQLILGAPDIDQREFRNSILPVFREIGKRRTLYASDHDMALQLSGFLRNYRDRLGMAGKEIFVAQGLDTIEASNVEVEDSHSYLFKSKSLLNDIYFLITRGLSPKERRLREIQNTPVNHWLFPK